MLLASPRDMSKELYLFIKIHSPFERHSLPHLPKMAAASLLKKDRSQDEVKGQGRTLLLLLLLVVLLIHPMLLLLLLLTAVVLRLDS